MLKTTILNLKFGMEFKLNKFTFLRLCFYLKKSFIKFQEGKKETFRLYLVLRGVRLFDLKYYVSLMNFTLINSAS